MKKSLLLLIVVLWYAKVESQVAPPFWDDIRAFQKQDSQARPLLHSTLFIGSSSFTRWTNVNTDFPEANILNRAFGGSALPDLTRYFYEIVYPYQPSKVFIYCGENDLAASDTVSSETVSMRFRTLYQMIRTNFPKCKIYFVSIKPSPSRAHIQQKVIEANRQIRAFLATQKNSAFIDIYKDMLDANGKMREELYVGDRLHMNATGYAIWIAKMKKSVFEKLKQ